MQNKKELTIEYVLDAPIKKVWQAWTNQEIVAKWWGPFGVSNPICNWDVKVNGKIDVLMFAGKELGNLAGNKWPMGGTFREIVENKKLVFTTTALDNKGTIQMENLNTIVFEYKNGKTKIILNVVVLRMEPVMLKALSGMETGWSQSFDKLSELFKK